MSFTCAPLQEMPWNTYTEKELLYDTLSKENKVKFLNSWVRNKDVRKNNWFYKEELRLLK